MENFSTEELLAIVNLTLIDGEDTHYHYDPETQFYNKCHNPEDGKFCSAPGAGKGITVSSRPDPDGVPTKGEVPEKRGKRGASLRDPHEGTRTIDGVRGYDKNGKPVPGTDAYLEAHNISRDLFESRPYIKYEASKTDPALLEAYPKDKYPKGHKLFTTTAEDTDPPQSGGYIMYKSPAPESPHGDIAPQIRPNAPVVTDKGERAKARTVLENSKKRLDVLEKTTPAQLVKERKLEVKRAKEDLARAEKATPEMVKQESTKNFEAAKAKFAKIKETADDPLVVAEARKELNREKRLHEKTLKRAEKPTFKEALIETKSLHLKSAENQLKNAIEDPEGALNDAIRRQKGIIKREANTYEKTAAKYLFTPGVTSARIDVSQDPQNIKNLTKGKGRIYLAMEGSIKNDAILTAIRKEDPTAAVVNVPSVTLWQQKNLAPEIPNEMGWFAQKYAKGRDVILIPDADGVKNNAVMSQAKALKSALLQNGAGQVYLATPPLKPGTTRVVEEFRLPSGKLEERKGIDDHLGAGRGTLGQLRYKTFTEYPDYDLTSYTKAGGATGKEKMSAGAQKNAEKVLAAISGLVEDRGVATIPLKTLNQTAGFRESQRTSARDARNTLERLGIIKVEYVYDSKALGRGERVLNPNMSAKRRDDLVRQGVIKEPHIYKKYVEVSFDESPVITIQKPEYIIKSSKVHTGALSELPDWNPPKTFKGWTSAVTNRPDTTGIASKQEVNHNKFVAKNTAKRAAARTADKVVEGRTTKERLAAKKAPPGRRLVRTEEGARRYGVPIGQPVPLSANAITSTVLLSAVMSEEEIAEFYNRCHDENGRFCEGDDGPGRTRDKKAPTSASDQWPPDKGRLVQLTQSFTDPTRVDGVSDVKTVYEAENLDGSYTKLYDKTGEAGPYVENLLNTQAKLNELYHINRGIVVTRDDDNLPYSRLPAGADAAVTADELVTVVNIDRLGRDIKFDNPTWNMPSSTSGNTKDFSYILTHEYGHQVDFARHWDGFSYKQHPLTRDPDFMSNVSRYGNANTPRTPGAEAYAETFAEWHHTKGSTRNPAARAMAEHEGWNANGYTSMDDYLAASADVTDLTLQNAISFQPEGEKMTVTVSDDFSKENGAKSEGNNKVIEPTKEEINRAKKIMQKILKEMKEGQ